MHRMILHISKYALFIMCNIFISAVTFQAAVSAEYNYLAREGERKTAISNKLICNFVKVKIGWFSPLYLGF